MARRRPATSSETTRSENAVAGGGIRRTYSLERASTRRSASANGTGSQEAAETMPASWSWTSRCARAQRRSAADQPGAPSAL
ncbi:MAG: hypothetical protein BGO95_11235 [Micrococcales bacterium 73-13]|nr:MAG: hypothetical protein BGO95_11235 [Micrococcales bacterium 73-13]